METLRSWLSSSGLFSSDFMPHGFCYLWNPRILWLHVISDALIALSYYCIPIILIYFIRKNRARAFNRIFFMFALFIVACGTTHLIEVWNVWHGSYLMAGIVKAITAAVSMLTAAILVKLVPQVISLPGRLQLQETNSRLEQEIAERKLTEQVRQERIVTRLVNRLRALASGAAVFSAAAGLSTLAGWKLHRVTLLTWGVPPVRTAPNAAACLVLLAISLWLLRKEDKQPFQWAKRVTAKAAAAAVCLMGCLVLAEHVLGWDFGIDQWLIVVPLSERIPGLRPGLIASSAACALILLGSALLLLNWKTRQGAWPAQYLSFGAAIVAVFGFFGLILAPQASGITMAFPAAATCFVLACGQVCARPTWAVGGLLSSHSAGAKLLRKVIPTALLVLALIGWSVSKPLLTDAHFTWVEISALAILCGALLVAFVTWIAFIVDRSDALNTQLERRVAERTAALRCEIAERQRMEEVRERLAAVVESSDDAIISKNLDGVITSWNTGAEKVFGYAASEAIGKPMQMLFPPDRATEEFDILARLRRAESVDHFETVRVRKDGKSIDVSTTISPIRDRSGAIVGASKIARDITERKRAQQALHESERRYRLLFSEMVEGFALLEVVFDQDDTPCDFRYLEVNPAFETHCGLSRETVLGKTIREILPGLEPVWIETYSQVATSGKSIHFENYAQSLGRWLELTAFRTHQGQVAVTFSDITARKQAEELLAAQSEELSSQAIDMNRSRLALETETLMLQSVLDSISEGLVVADEQEKFVIWNPAAETILGFGPTKRASAEWPAHYGFFLPDTVTPLLPEQDPLIRALHGEVCTTEMFVRNPKIPEGVWIEASASPLIDKNGIARGGVIAFRDISSNKAVEREIRKLNDELEIRVMERTAQLEAANKELEAFSYSVSHDLRAPLRHISGFSQLLAEEFGASLDPVAKHYLDRIQAGTQKMGMLIDELLNLARVGRHALHRQPTRLNAVVEEVIAVLHPEIEGRGVEWVVADLPAIGCDAVLVKQVFQNLLANALKFTRPRAQAIIEICIQGNEYGVPVFMVRDNGVGFSMKYVDKLFGVFQRLHVAEDFEGTGIGLATVQRVVQKHGGRVWAEGEIDKGATFYFTLGAEKEEEKETGARSNKATLGGQL